MYCISCILYDIYDIYNIYYTYNTPRRRFHGDLCGLCRDRTLGGRRATRDVRERQRHALRRAKREPILPTNVRSGRGAPYGTTALILGKQPSP